LLENHSGFVHSVMIGLLPVGISHTSWFLKKWKSGAMKKNLKINLILREENFGGILFDRHNLTYKFLSHEEVEQLDKNFYQLRKTNKEYPDNKIISAPVRVYWEITRKCNLKCPQCFNNSTSALPGELDLEECLKVIRGLKSDGVIEVRITGGEPTQKEGWDKLVACATEEGLVVSLNTNGVFSDDSTVEKIGRSGIDQVIVSVDGPKKIHEESRGKGNFKKVIKTIKKLNYYQTSVRANILLTKKVLPYIEEMVYFLKDMVQEICFMQLKPIGRGGKILSLAPSHLKMIEVDKRLGLLRKSYPELKISSGYDFIPTKKIIPVPCLDLTTCASGFRGCNLDSRGNIYSCGFLEEISCDYSLGNIVKESYSLLDVWHNSNKLNSFRKANLRKTRKCQKCQHFRKVCFGSCVVMEQYKLRKSISGRDPYCYKENERK